ncbi:MAG: SDR family NAD(P)-dependent oxidoreductase [Pseudomonadota bacterium]
MTAADDRLLNRTILITGAGSGLGRALAVDAGKSGATVILIGRKVPELETTYDAIEAAGGPQPAIIPLDLLSATTVEYSSLSAQLADTFGTLHGLVHCAATLGALTPLEHYPQTTWAEVFTTNLHAPLVLTQACMPLLHESAPASVVFTLDDRLSAYWGAYGLSKAAARATVSMLADECDGKRLASGRPRVTVNGVRPGPMRTRLRQLAFPGELPETNPLPETRTAPYLRLLAADSRDNGQFLDA